VQIVIYMQFIAQNCDQPYRVQGPQLETKPWWDKKYTKYSKVNNNSEHFRGGGEIAAN